MANKIALDFTQGKVEFETSGQKGVESSAELAAQKDGILQVLGLEKEQITHLAMDFEASTVQVTYSIPKLKEKRAAFLQAMDYEQVDMSNTFRLIEALFNQELPPSLVKMLLEHDLAAPDADKVISDFLGLLPNE